MTIDEAIEILRRRKKGRNSIGQFDDVKALQLGIEALEWIKKHRTLWDDTLGVRLPSETNDYCKFCGIVHTDIECPSREGEK